MSSSLPSGFDILDEENIPPISTQPGFVKEDPDSPEIEFSEQCTVTHSFTCDWNDALNLRIVRGTFLSDSFGNITRVLTCRIKHQKGRIGKITIAAESISFAVPPDKFSYDSVESNPAMERNPRYTSPFGQPQNLLTHTDLVNIHAAIESPQEATRTEAITTGNPYGSDGDTPNPFLFDLWNELLATLRRGEDSYYFAGIKITWTSYAYQPQVLDLGGYIQDPTIVLPSTAFTGPDGIIIPEGMTFLRLSDQQPFNRTWWEMTRTWIGFTLGHWNSNIYPTH